MTDEREIQNRASFGLLRYASCWEDTEVLLEALNVKPGANCFSIASAGDNSLALLTKDPELVLAIDISSTQLACLELKVAAFRLLDYEDLLIFLGYKESYFDRIKIYEKISKDLSSQSKLLMDKKISAIAKGIIHTGKFEKYFQTFHNYILPLVHNKLNVEMLLAQKNQQKRNDFYDTQWNTFRWKLLFKIFFSRFVMGHAGRDPEFFKYVEGSVADRILERAHYAFTALSTHDNPYLEYIMTGRFKNNLPFYVQQQNYEKIRQNLDRLVLFHGTIDRAINKDDLMYDCFNLSDIFEYMDSELFKKTAATILSKANKGSRLVYWNMLAERIISQQFTEELKHLTALSEKLFLEDKAFFYSSLHIEEKL